jgi:hypothetical protein
MSQTFGWYFLNHIPMFYDFTVFHSEQIVKHVFFTTIQFAFAYGQNKVPFAQNFVEFGVFENYIVGRGKILNGFSRGRSIHL